MKRLETKTEKEDFTIFGVDWKQWIPVYGIWRGMKGGFYDGKLSISTTDNDYLYWGAKVYHGLTLLGTVAGVCELFSR